MSTQTTPKFWTTNSEIEFLNTIGDALDEMINRNLPADTRITIDRKELLRGYLESAQKRSRWGRMDRAACINHAKLLLAKMEGRK